VLLASKQHFLCFKRPEEETNEGEKKQ